MRHRALDYAPHTPVAELGLAALDDILDRGDLADWTPLLREIRRDPRGQVAERILHLVAQRADDGTSALWRSWIARERDSSHAGVRVGPALRAMREHQNLTQSEVARRLGTTQPDISKLERRTDARLSTVRTYIAAVGGRLRVTAVLPDGEREIG